jgi:hypothetical protein
MFSPTVPAITDAEAMTLASLWHTSTFGPSVAFSSTGAIENVPILTAFYSECKLGAEEGDREELAQLVAYVRRNGPRGPVPGWGKLPWQDKYEG